VGHTSKAGFGIRYDLTKRVCISVEPVYRQFINSIVVDRKAKEYPYSIGANVGIYYSFRKKSKAAATPGRQATVK